jgi:hypothetical protein
MRAISRNTDLGLSRVKLVLFKAGLYEPKHKTCNAQGNPICSKCGSSENVVADRTNGTLCRRCKTEKDRKFTLKYSGSNEAEYQNLLRIQGGKCAICGKVPESDRRLALDHCHTTGQFRGLLCFSCNTALGHLNDDPEVVAAAYRYLVEGGVKSRSKHNSEQDRSG